MDDAKRTTTETAGEKPNQSTTSLREVLDEIGAEEAVARLEMRIGSLEGEIERADRRLHEFERARRGELDVMRARVEDVLAATDEMLDEHRGGAKDQEERVGSLVSEATATARMELHELRDTLTPHVQQSVHDAEIHVRALRGEMARLQQDTEVKLTAATEQVAAVEGELHEFRELAMTTTTKALGEHAANVADLRAEVTSRITTMETAAEARQQDAAERLEALRRELDAATGELRASVSMRASELKSDLGSLRAELTEAADVGQSRDDDLEERWITATKGVADKIEHAVGRVEIQVRKEREERQVAMDRSDERLGEALSRLDVVGDKVDSVNRPRVDDLRRTMTDMDSRVGALQVQVAAAVGQIASELNNRVAVVGGNVDAVRATAALHTEELGRLGDVSQAVEGMRSDFVAALAEIRAEMKAASDQSTSGVSGDDQVRATQEAVRLAEASSAQTREVVTMMTAMQEELRALAGLRQEVRDQASTLVEAVTRAESAELAAIQTREAVAAAVRRGREARAVSRPPTEEPASE
ncbi:MAG: putative phage infection (PIP) family protein YhgE [Glaciecola sp.]|jgi:uncharacterized phage infection (PIP) family protein YhgE